MSGSRRSGGQIAEVNEKICEARPGAAGQRRDAALSGRRGKGGLLDALAAETSAEIGRLAAKAARSLGCGGAGLEAAEAVIRAGMLKLGGGMLGSCWPPIPGHRGPRVPCGQGHEAEFVSYRDKVLDTVLGPVTLTAPGITARPAARAGPARRRARSGGQSMSPGLAAMNDRAAAAGPFAGAAGLLEDLAGVRLTAKRVERAAEAAAPRRPPRSGTAPR